MRKFELPKYIFLKNELHNLMVLKLAKLNRMPILIGILKLQCYQESQMSFMQNKILRLPEANKQLRKTKWLSKSHVPLLCIIMSFLPASLSQIPLLGLFFSSLNPPVPMAVKLIFMRIKRLNP